MTAPAQPLIGFGQVWHQRLRPRPHAFRYPGYFLLLPLRQLARTPSPLLARNRRGWLSFHDRDHGDGGPDALAWCDALLRQEGIADADGEVWLHTFPRVLGYAFKPVSFWYVHRADGGLAAVLAEVNNTFGERHVYLLDGPGLRWGAELQARKVFHVSPFCQVQGHYRFRFWRSDAVAAAGPTPGRPRSLVRVDLHDEAGPLLRTSIGGVLQPLSAAALRRACWGHPLMTWGVLARIHLQAWQLWRKRLPFFTKPEAPARFVTR